VNFFEALREASVKHKVFRPKFWKDRKVGMGFVIFAKQIQDISYFKRTNGGYSVSTSDAFLRVDWILNEEWVVDSKRTLMLEKRKSDSIENIKGDSAKTIDRAKRKPSEVSLPF